MNRTGIPKSVVTMVLAGFCLVWTAFAWADTEVGGYLETDTIWNLTGNPYIVTDTIIVGYNTTLTVEAGVEVKFNPDYALRIEDGTLLVTGSISQPVIFTSNQSSPAPGNWQGLELLSGSNSNIQHSVIEYANVGIRIVESSPQIIGTTLRSNGRGIEVEYPGWGSQPPQPIIHNCALYANTEYNYALRFGGASQRRNVGILDATQNWWGTADIQAIRASIYDYANDNTLAMVNFASFLDAENGNPVLGPQGETYLIGGTSGNLTLSGNYLVPFGFKVQPGHVLTIAPGATFKFMSGAFLEILGAEDPATGIAQTRLNAGSATGSPVIFTSSQATPAAGDWAGIRFIYNSGGTLQNCIIEYATIGVSARGYASPQISGSTLRYNQRGLQAERTASASIPDRYEIPQPVVNNCSVYGNTEYQYYVVKPSLTSARWDLITLNASQNWWGTADPQAIQASIYDYTDEHEAAVVNFSSFLASEGGAPATTPTGETYLIGGTFSETTVLDGAYVIPFFFKVQMTPTGMEHMLRIDPGTILKFMPGAYLQVGSLNTQATSAGVLLVNGSSDRPVTFTSMQTAPAMGAWSGVQFYRGSRGNLTNCVIEYADKGIYAYGRSNMGIESATLRKNNRGIEVASQGSDFPTVGISNSALYQNGEYNYYVTGSANRQLSAPDNWWGTADETEIAATIWDSADDAILATVNYTPWRTFLADTTGPVVSEIQYNGVVITAGATITRSGEFYLNATDEISEMGRVEFYVNDELQFTDNDPNGGYTFAWNIATLNSGVYTLKIRAYDTLENVTEVLLEDLQVQADTAGPVVSEIQYNGTAIAAGATIARPGEFDLNASDDPSGVSRVEFYINAELQHTDNNPSGGYTFAWNITAINDGVYTLKIRAYDTLENVTEALLEDLRVRLAPPATPVITSPVSGTHINYGAPLTITGTVEYATGITVYENETPLVTDAPVNADGTFSLEIALTPGAHALQVSASNRGGEGARTAQLLVTMDAAPDLANGLLVYYPFNGNADDESGHGWHGTAYNVTDAANRFGRANSAYGFDGQTSYVNGNANAAFNNLNDFTLQAWIYLPNAANGKYKPIMSKHQNDGAGNELAEWDFQVQTNGNLNFFMGSSVGYGVVLNGGDLASNTWHQIAVTVAGTSVQLYRNGQLAATGTFTGQRRYGTAPFQIGRFDNQDPGVQYFYGTIDDVRMYNRALTQTEVQTLYQLGEEFRANFVAAPVAGPAPLTVQFTDLSTNAPTSWDWDFNNDGTVDAHDPNPTYTYQTDGLYTVKLTVNQAGATKTRVNSNYILVDSAAPGMPRGFEVTSQPNGQIRLAWQQPSGEVPFGYNLYRATTIFTEPAVANRINAQPYPSVNYTELLNTDGTYYYAVAAVDQAGNESPLTPVRSATVDTTPPVAQTITYTPHGTYGPNSGRMGPGLVDIRLTVSELLLTTPFLSITPTGGTPLTVELAKSSDREYTGSFTITANTPAGTAYAVFSARDLVGNRGTEILAGATLNIDAAGPAVSRITVDPAGIIKNDINNPVVVTVTIGLTEAVKSGEFPELAYQLSGAGRQPITLATLMQVAAQTGEQQAWQGTFTLPADAGVSAETFHFSYRGRDDLDNVSTKIQSTNLFEVYQGELPALIPPTNLKAQAQPAGHIKLSWESVAGAVSYQLFRQAPGESDLTTYQRLGTVLEFVDAPTLDGVYIYAVASIRQANGQESSSVRSASVTAQADSVAPQAPVNLSLELVGAGIKAQWAAAPGTNEPVTYALYRANTLAISSVAGLSPLKTGITTTVWIDAAPSPSAHCYVVTARDAAGNESAPSNSLYLNFTLLPVSSITVRQTNTQAPVLTWTHAGGDLAGYNLYLGNVKLNPGLLTTPAFTDAGYTNDERQYAVTAVDPNGVESPRRSLTLPVVTIALKDGAKLYRNLMNRVEYVVTNQSANRIEQSRLVLEIQGQTYTSANVSLNSGETLVVPVTVGGDPNLPDLTPIAATLEITPNAGELIALVRNAEIPVSDGMLVLGLRNEEFIRGGTGQVRFTLENTSAEEIEIVTATNSGAAPSDEVSLQLVDPDGNVLATGVYQQVLGTGVITNSAGKTVARIPAGGRFTSEPLNITIPANAPENVTLRLTVAHVYYRQGTAAQVTLAGPRTTQPVSLIDTSYYGEVLTVTPAVARGGQTITIAGQAIDRATNNPLALVPLKLVIAVNGFERTKPVYTDANGLFTYVFTPLPGEAGVYTVWAVHPDRTDKPEQGHFTINRINVTPTEVNLNIPRNYPQSLSFTMTAGDGTEVHNLRLVYAQNDQPEGSFLPGVQVTLAEPVATLAAQQSATLTCQISADNAAATAGKLVLAVQSDETGAESWAKIVINTQFSEAKPVLFFTPDHLETGLVLGDSATETLTLENRGLADLEDVTLTLRDQNGAPAPAWVHLNAAANQGTLAVGAKRDISLSFTPAAPAVAEGLYEFYLHVSSANYPETDILLFTSVSQSGVGNVLFKVADIYTGTQDPQTQQIIQGLAGATIKVQNEEVLTIELTLTTDALGEALFTDLPVGRYKCRLTADKHQEQIVRFWIKPGITSTEEVFLKYNLVTVEWGVTETTIEDKYEVTLSATYETDVPVAVVVAEPTSVNLPDMQAGEVLYGEFTLTNYGLVRADHIRIIPPTGNQFFTYELLAAIPESLQAKERITIPYRITSLKPLNQTTETGSGGGCQAIWMCNVIKYDSICANGTVFENSTEQCYLAYQGECSTTGGVLTGGISINVPSPDLQLSPVPNPQPLEGLPCPANADIKRSEEDAENDSSAASSAPDSDSDDEGNVPENPSAPKPTDENQNEDTGCSVNTLLGEYNDEALILA